jgi:hypothetical protein
MMAALSSITLNAPRTIKITPMQKATARMIFMAFDSGAAGGALLSPPSPVWTVDPSPVCAIEASPFWMMFGPASLFCEMMSPLMASVPLLMM